MLKSISIIILLVSVSGCLSPFYKKIEKTEADLPKGSYYSSYKTIKYRRLYLFSKSKNDSTASIRYYKMKEYYYGENKQLRLKKKTKDKYEGQKRKKHHTREQNFDGDGKRISNREAFENYQRWWR